MLKQKIKVYLALFSVILSGSAGLIYEVSWHKYLCNLLGSQAKASAIILSVFLGGLSAGYLLFGKLSKNKDQKSLLQLAAWIEIAIGLWAIFFPFIYMILWNKVRILPSSGIIAFILETFVCCLLILVPTTLMGSTLPLLTKGLVDNTDATKSIHALIYSFNTFGAFIGTLLAGFYILPTYGLSTTVQASSILNVLAGILLFACSQLKTEQSKPDVIVKNTNSFIEFKKAGAIVLVLGFCSISLQTCLIRLLSLAAGSSEYSFTIVVSMFVLLLAIGALSVKNIEITPNTLTKNLTISLFGLFIVYLTAQDWPYYCYIIRALLRTVEPNFYFYNLLLLIFLASICILAIGYLGRTLPIVFASVVNKYENSGDTVGILYSLNALGCILGATIGGYFLLYYVDLYLVLKICMLLIGICIPVNKKYHLLTLVILTIAIYKLPVWSHEKLSSGVFRHVKITPYTFTGPSAYYKEVNQNFKTLFAKDDPNSTIRIIESKADSDEIRLNRGAPFIRSLYVNGKSDGQTSYGDMDTMKLAAHLPMLLLAEQATNVAVIGLGLGVSAGTAALYPEVKKLDIIEISQALIKASYLFDFANNSLSASTKANYIIGDAYRVLGGSSNKYSLIISEPSNPWVTGVERLYTKEYFEIIKDKLTPKGIYAQWFHLYSISEPTLGIVLSTFNDSFEHTRLFIVDSDIILLGSNQKLALESTTALKQRYDSNQFIRDDLKLIKILDIESLLELETWLPVQLYADEQKHTLEFPKLAYAAGKDFFMDRSVEYKDLIDRLDYSPWIRRKSSDILFSYLVSQTENKVESLVRYTNMACKKFNLFDELPKNLEILYPHCKEASIALSLVGKISHKNNFTEQEAALIRQLLINSDSQEEEETWIKLGLSSTLHDLRKLIALFTNYDSAFTPLSPKKLILATQSCFATNSDEATTCQIELTYALANRGWGVLAKNTYDRLSSSIKAQNKSLKMQVDSALEAERRIR
jgi:spermidine synthase